MYVAKDDSAAAAFNQGRSMQGLQEVPLGQRATSTSGRNSVVTPRYTAATLCPPPLSLPFVLLVSVMCRTTMLDICLMASMLFYTVFTLFIDKGCSLLAGSCS